MIDRNDKPKSMWTKADYIEELAYYETILSEQRAAMRELKLDLQRARDEAAFLKSVAIRPDTALMTAQRLCESAATIIQALPIIKDGCPETQPRAKIPF